MLFFICNYITASRLITLAITVTLPFINTNHKDELITYFALCLYPYHWTLWPFAYIISFK